jgi:asparagine synthase (glutamine-hydrolysing)
LSHDLPTGSGPGDRAARSTGYSWHVDGTLIYKGLAADEGAKALLADEAGGRIAADRLHGAYAITTRAPNGTRVLADPMGLQHLFTDSSGGGLSSSLLAAARKGGCAELDREGLLLCLACGFFPGAYTPVRGIRRVLPCETAVGEIRILRLGATVTADRPADFAEARARLIEAVQAVLRDARGFVGEAPVGLGLSGGYDSRLLLAAARRAGMDVQCFSHFKLPPDRDLAVARRVAAAAGVPLAVVETPLPEAMVDADLRRVAEASFNLYDGRVHLGLELPRQEYTPDYRRQVSGTCALVLSGVGGELFRNHDHGVRGEVGLRRWVEERVVGRETLNSFTERAAREWVVDWLCDYVAARLDLGSRRRLDLSARRRFYAEIWLPEWHGLRNGVESRLGPYLAPFADPVVIAEALAATHFVGAGGALEAAMIVALDPVIARVPSVYGFGFDRIPLAARLAAELRCTLPAVARTVGRLRRSRSGASSAFERLSARPGLFRDAVEWLSDLGLPVNWSQYGAGRGEAMLALGLGCAIGLLQGRLATERVEVNA